MKTVTVNGVAHELSPDALRSRDSAALVQDIVTAVNALETGTSPDGLELTSTDATKNVITADSSDATTTGSVAAMTFHNTVAHTANDLEFNFTNSANTSLLSLDKEGDALISGALGVTGTATAGAFSSAGAATVGSVSTPTITGAALSAKGTTADGGSAIGTTVGSTVTYSTSGAKELSVKNNTVEVASVDYSGALSVNGSVALTGGILATNLAAPVITYSAPNSDTTTGHLAATTTYYYWLVATNAFGQSLAPTAGVPGTTGAGVDTNSIGFTWPAIAGATGYALYRHTADAIASAKLAMTITSGATLLVKDTSVASLATASLVNTDTSSRLKFTGGSPVLITSSCSDALASSSVAAITLQPTVALTSGDLVLDVQQSTGTSLLKVAQTTGDATVLGVVSSAGLSNSGVINLTSFTDDSATPGDRTVNKTRGINKLASAGAPTTLTITNSLVTSTSLVLAVLQTADATATIKNIVPGTGSFVITFGAAATADTKVGWVVIN